MYTFRKMPLTNNNPYREVQEIKAFVFHYTGNDSAGANAVANRNYFQNNPGIYCSSNYIVDQDYVLECIAPGMVAFHAGGESYTNYAKNNFTLNGRVKPNDFAVGFEMCNNSDGSWSQTIANTVEFAARLAVNLGVPNVDLIRHYDVTWKDCPAPMVENSSAWFEFKQRIRNRIIELKGSPVSETTHSTSSAITSEAIGIGVIRVNSVLNVRAEANASSSVLGTLSNGNQVGIVAKENGWYKISYSNGYGYVSSDYVEAESIGVVTASVLNVRTGNGTSYDKVGSLPNGTKVAILGSSNGWYHIACESINGWVSGEYLNVTNFSADEKKEEKTTVEASTQTEPQEAGFGTVTASVLNVRKGASTDSEIVGQLQRGDKIKLDCKVGNWWSTYYGEHGGFVYADYIQN